MSAHWQMGYSRLVGAEARWGPSLGSQRGPTVLQLLPPMNGRLPFCPLSSSTLTQEVPDERYKDPPALLPTPYQGKLTPTTLPGEKPLMQPVIS